eukprot:8563238-Prorocentrum_lima.AAC.1
MLNSQQWDHQQPGLQPHLYNKVIHILGSMSSTLALGTRGPRLSPAGPLSLCLDVCKNYGYVHLDHQ